MAKGAESDEGRLVAARYRLLERIGRGGMGTVWRAEDEMLGRHVALKKLHVPPHLADDERATLYERTRREARSAARIAHLNVVVVHDVVDDEGLPCIVMEYVPSRTLGEVLKEDGPVSPQEAARIGRSMIAALRAAHAAGVLHRDVKPGNVLLGADGRVVLTDFGIAMASGTSTLTRTGELVGSIDYVAPERVRGGNPGPASDLWALGATLYQAVEGRPPFRKATAIETAYSIAVDPLEPPRRAGALTGLIEQLLAKEPEARPDAETVERGLRVPAAEAETAAVDPTLLLGAGRTGSGSGSRGTGTGSGSTGTGSGGSGTGSGGGTGGGSVTDAGPGGAGGATTRRGSDAATARTPSGPPEPSDRQRLRRTGLWAVTGVLVTALAVGGTLLALRDADSGVKVSGAASGPEAGGEASTSPEPSPAPSGYHLFHEKQFDISFPLPNGWRRRVKSGQEINYLDATGRVGIKINVLDFASGKPLQHFKDVERKLKAEEPTYKQLRLQRTTFRGEPAAVWELTFEGSARTYRAIDLGFGREGGKEYAIYLSAPADEWDRHRPIFDVVRDGLRLPSA
ncbi:serine/threonine-protein kinase [Streptomyces sp. 8N706]|uniref:serine/threonine-protein kinase n=1 Tax=Streptomyces sp. 8N706 TaxID=3457416 RepID=UPI003FD3734D